MVSIAIKVGIAFALSLGLVQFVYADCNLWSQDSSLLKARNNTILIMMNSTLISATNAANNSIGSVLTFTLWSYLQRSYSVTPANFLHFVSMGKLYAIDWTLAVTAMLTTNLSLASSVKNNYVIPLHEKLQHIASKYSFSLGIFRPKQMQFNFTGVTVTSNASSTFSSLDISCMAGSSFVWQAGLDLPYLFKFNSSYSFSAAVLATLLENAFDNYYRKNTSALNTEFVRANFMKAFSVAGLTTVHIETYFRSPLLSKETILNFTSISKFPAMTFTDDVRYSTFTIIPSSGATFITNASYFYASDMSSTSTSTEATSALSTASSTALFSTSTSIEITSTNFASSSSISADSTTTTGSPTTTTIAATSQTSNISDAAVVTDTSLYPTSRIHSPNSITITDVTVESTLTMQKSSSSSSNSASNILSTEAQITTANFLTSLPKYSSTNHDISNASTGSTVLISTTKATSPVPIQSTGFRSTTLSAETSSVASNLSRSGTTSNPIASNTGTVNTGMANSNGSMDGKTTFDTDAFFKAQVPVITKVYNDHYLLRFQIGTMAPITEKLVFFTITLPAAIGIIASAVFCMICWQVDCLKGRK